MGMSRMQRRIAIDDEQRIGAVVPADSMGGALVLQRLSIGDVSFKRGQRLTAAQVLAMRPDNRRAMIVNRYIELGPADNRPLIERSNDNAIRHRARAIRRQD
jgi:hypothetical protein